jgi:dynein heavy chain
MELTKDSEVTRLLSGADHQLEIIMKSMSAYLEMKR